MCFGLIERGAWLTDAFTGENRLINKISGGMQTLVYVISWFFINVIQYHIASLFSPNVSFLPCILHGKALIEPGCKYGDIIEILLIFQ